MCQTYDAGQHERHNKKHTTKNKNNDYLSNRFHWKTTSGLVWAFYKTMKIKTYRQPSTNAIKITDIEDTPKNDVLMVYLKYFETGQQKRPQKSHRLHNHSPLDVDKEMSTDGRRSSITAFFLSCVGQCWRVFTTKNIITMVFHIRAQGNMNVSNYFDSWNSIILWQLNCSSFVQQAFSSVYFKIKCPILQFVK